MNQQLAISKCFIKDRFKSLRIYHCFLQANSYKDMEMCRIIENAAQLNQFEINLKETKLSPRDTKCLTILLTCSSQKE